MTVEQMLALARRQRRGRLVEDDDAAVHRQRLQDLDQLALREAEVVHQRVERQRRAPAQVHPPARAPAPAAGASCSAPAMPMRGSMMFSSTDRSGASEVSCVTMAMPRADRLARAGEADRRAVQQHLAAVRLDVAGDDARERRLAGAVRADQRVHLARLQVERGA